MTKPTDDEIDLEVLDVRASRVLQGRAAAFASKVLHGRVAELLGKLATRADVGKLAARVDRGFTQSDRRLDRLEASNAQIEAAMADLARLIDERLPEQK